jgi:hypothetical protein
VVCWSRGQSCERAASSAAVDFVSTKKGLDHRVGHFRPLSIMAYILKRLVLSTVRCFCVVQQQKGVADAMIEAQSEFLLAGQSYAGCRKTCGRGVKRTQILAMGCSTRKPALWQGSPVCRKNGRILLANPLQSSRSTFSRGSFLSFFAFQEGMLGTPISLLGGWPTVSGRFLHSPRIKILHLSKVYLFVQMLGW